MAPMPKINFMKLSTHTNYKCDITQNWTVEQEWNSFFDSHFSGLPIIKSNGRSRFLIGLGKLHCISSLGWWWSGSILRPNITAAIGVLFVNGRGEAVINKKCISNYLFLYTYKKKEDLFVKVKILPYLWARALTLSWHCSKTPPTLSNAEARSPTKSSLSASAP